jgi:hypothetical protein
LGIFSHPAQTDRTFKFVRAAYIWLLVSCFMLPFYLFYGKLTGTDVRSRLHGGPSSCFHGRLH